MSLRENVVFIGRKPIMTYVTALMTGLQNGSVFIRARGKVISMAVDVVEVTKNRFFKDLIIEGIKIGTEVLGEEGDKRNVSTIEIQVSRPR